MASWSLSFQCEFGSFMCPLFDWKLLGAAHCLYMPCAPAITPRPRQSQVRGFSKFLGRASAYETELWGVFEGISQTKASGFKF
jgi:hypothetical protein